MCGNDSLDTHAPQERPSHGHTGSAVRRVDSNAGVRYEIDHVTAAPAIPSLC